MKKESNQKEMTFKDLLKLEYPSYVNNCFFAGCRLCPKDYGYEEIKPEFCHLDNCVKCWERPLPKELKELIQILKPRMEHEEESNC